MEINYKTLEQSITKNGYKFFDKGEYNLNFIWVRNDLIADNHFTDDLYIAYREKGIEKVLNVKCTTVPGLKGSLYNPVVVDGVKGTAIIKEGQCLGAWEFRDVVNEFTNYPYFRQIKPIDYYRDGNGDNIIDLVQEQDGKLYKTHWHVMSNEGDKRKIEEFEVNNWSLGCMGCPRSEWNKVIELTRKAIKAGQKNIFSGTIIQRKNL